MRPRGASLREPGASIPIARRSSMALIVTWLHLSLQAATILLFPAVALMARHAGGPGRIWRAAGLAMSVILLFAAVVASPSGGNALASTYGYGYTASRAMLLYGLTLGLPVISSSCIVHVFGDRLRSRPGLYVLGVVCAVLAWAVGVVAATRIISAIG
jgi:hypothetical protein